MCDFLPVADADKGGCGFGAVAGGNAQLKIFFVCMIPTFDCRDGSKVLKSTPMSSVAEHLKLEELESYRLVEEKVDQIAGFVQFILHQRIPQPTLVD